MMVNITNHEANANQSPGEIPFPTNEGSSIKKTNNRKCWQGCGGTGMFPTLLTARKMVPLAEQW